MVPRRKANVQAACDVDSAQSLQMAAKSTTRTVEMWDRQLEKELEKDVSPEAH